MTMILTISITLTLTLTSLLTSSSAAAALLSSPPHHGHAISKLKSGLAAAKDSASKDFDIVDSPKRIGEDIARNVTGAIHEMGQKSFNDVACMLKHYVLVLYRDYVGWVVGWVHILGFSTAYGMCVWVTFVLSYVLERCLSRHVFSVVQRRVYKVYFKAMAYSVSTALFGHFTGCETGFLASNMGLFQSLCLVSALLMVLINLKLLEPEVTKVVHERMKMEKDQRRAFGAAVKDGMAGGGATLVKTAASAVAERQDVLRLNERLKRLNACSSALNLATLVALTWHMAYMGQLLQATE